MKKLISILQEDSLIKYQWLLPDGNLYSFMERRLKKTFYFILFIGIMNVISFIIAYFLKLNLPVLVMCIITISLVLLFYKIDYWKIKMTFQSKRDSVYQSFPLWISTLEILVMTNNIPNTFKKSIATCPTAFKQDLKDFVEKIEFDPENKQHYREFLTKYNIDEVDEIIMDMYSFNKLNKNEIVLEFSHLNERLNKISNRLRTERQSRDLFFISALNSVPILTVSIYVLVISMAMNGM